MEDGASEGPNWWLQGFRSRRRRLTEVTMKRQARPWKSAGRWEGGKVGRFWCRHQIPDSTARFFFSKSWGLRISSLDLEPSTADLHGEKTSHAPPPAIYSLAGHDTCLDGARSRLCSSSVRRDGHIPIICPVLAAAWVGPVLIGIVCALRPFDKLMKPFPARRKRELQRGRIWLETNFRRHRRSSPTISCTLR